MSSEKKPLYVVENNLPWKHIFVSLCKFFFLQAILGTLVSAIFARIPGIMGYLSGAILVFICFSISILVAVLAGRRSMTDVARSLVVAYVIKVLVLGAVLMLVPIPSVIRNGWMLAGAVISVFIWLIVEAQALMKLRILYFDEIE